MVLFCSWNVNKVDFLAGKERVTFYIHPEKQYFIKPYQDLDGPEQWLKECNVLMVQDANGEKVDVTQNLSQTVDEESNSSSPVISVSTS